MLTRDVVRALLTQHGARCLLLVARRDPGVLTENDLAALCRANLVRYKRPKQVRFIPLEDLPRSTTGKVQRHEIEKRLIQPDTI